MLFRSWLLPALCEARGLPIRGYGTTVVLAVGAGTGLVIWRTRRLGIDPDLILSLAFWMFVPGIIGARAFYVIEYWPSQYGPILEEDGFRAVMAAVVNLTQGGLVVYGSFLGAALGLLAFARRDRLPTLPLCDLIAPGLALGLALGRVGCLMNGCCFGGPCDLPWAVTFPCDSPVHFYQVEHGHTFVHGLKIAAGPEGQPVIKEVQPGSPPDLEGLVAGQQIARINGRTVSTPRGATIALLGANKVSVATEGSRYIARWTLEARPPDSPPEDDPAYVRDVTAGRAFIHGLKVAGNSRHQPVIAEVEPGSPAQQCGLKPTQRITAVNGQPVATVAGAVGALLEADRLSIATAENGRIRRWRVDGPSCADHAVLPVHPTQVYGSINALFLCLLLLAYDPFCRRDGQLSALLLSVYAITRFLLEIIRTDESAVFGTGLSISQNVSLALLVFAVGLWFYVLRRPPGREFTDQPSRYQAPTVGRDESA